MRNHIFISYRWGDRESDDNLGELVTEIEQTSGLTAFWDTRGLRSGAFVNVLQENVISADIFMPIVTKNYIKFGKEGGRDEDKDFCLFEYASAVAAGRKIVPIFCGVEGNTKTESYDKAKAAAQKVLDLDYSDEDIKLLKEYLILQNGVSLGMLNAEEIQNNNSRLCSLIFDTFCSNESDIIFYKKHLENLSATLNPIRIYGDFDDNGLTLGNSYIPLSFLRHLTKSERREKESMKESTAPTDSSENDLTTALEKERLAVVVGDAGQGKSSFVRHLSIRLAKNAEQFGLSRELFFPMYFECKSIDRDSMSSHDEFLNKLAKEAGFNKPALDAVMRFGKPLFIFDAMDEISPGQMDALIEGIYKYIFLKNEKAHILFTSRPGQKLVAGNNDMTLNNGDAIVRKYSVKEFDEMQRESYICALAVAKKTAPEEKDAFVQAINKKETEIADYRSISRSPFMLFAIFSTYVKGQELPDNRFDAICRIIDDIIRRDLERIGYDMFDSKNIKEILGAVSYTFNRQRDEGITPHLKSNTPLNCAKKIYKLDDSDLYDRKLINKYREFFSHNDFLDENGFRHEFLAATYAAYYLFFLIKREVRKGNSPIKVSEISSLKKNTDYWKSVLEALLCLLDRESEDSKTYIEPLLEEMQKEETPDYDLLCSTVSQFTNHQSRAAGMLLSGMLDRGCIGILTEKKINGKFTYQNGANPYEELFYYTAVYPYLQQYLPNLTAEERQGEEHYLCNELIKEICALFSDKPEEELHNVYSGRNDGGHAEINTRMEDAAYRFGEDIKGYVVVSNKKGLTTPHFVTCDKLTNISVLQDTIHFDTSFWGCDSLIDIFVDRNNAFYSSADGVLFNKDISKLICYPPGKNGAYTIPNSVTEIGKDAFYGCTGLTSITIPDSVAEIALRTFKNCTGLTIITIPYSVTEIGPCAFMCCTSLNNINVAINNTVYSSEDGVLFNKDKTTLIQCPGGKAGTYTIPRSVTQIYAYAFSDCTDLTHIAIPNSVTKIGVWAFSRCTSLTSITIPDSVTEIGSWTFQNCTNLTYITIPDNLTKIGDSAFSECMCLNRINVGINNIAYSSDNGVLFNKDKTVLVKYPNAKTGSYMIPGSVKSICDFAFSQCIVLESVIIPGSVTTIGLGSFVGCTSLTSITITDTVTEIGYFAFEGCPNLTIHAPKGSFAEAYAKENEIPFVEI